MDYAQQQRNPAKHLVGFTLVVLLHVVIVYALINGLARKVVDVIKGPLEAKVVEEHRPPPPPDTPPPPPPKLLVPPPPFIPPPEIQIAVATPPNTITQVTNTKPPPGPAPVAVAPKAAPIPATPASFDRSSCVTPEPNYPMASKRNQETGAVVLRIQIGANGSLDKIDVVSSSGHSRLDEAARTWATSCKFKPGTVDGKPVAGAVTQAYTFNLQD